MPRFQICKFPEPGGGNEGKGDAVYNNLAYLPVCNCMPVCRSGCRNPTWMWTKKENATGR